MQCTTCLKIGHSTIECNLRTRCTICHSKAHFVEQCEYNFLNKATTSVRQIHRKDSYQENKNRFVNRSQEADRYDNRYHSNHRDESQRQNNDTNWNDYQQNDRYDSNREEDRQNDYCRDDCSNRDQDYSPPLDNGH